MNPRLCCDLTIFLIFSTLILLSDFLCTFCTYIEVHIYLFFFFLRLCREQVSSIRYYRTQVQEEQPRFRETGIFLVIYSPFLFPKLLILFVFVSLFQMVYSVFLTCSGQLWVWGSASFSAPTANYPGSHILNSNLLRERIHLSHVVNDVQHPCSRWNNPAMCSQ